MDQQQRIPVIRPLDQSFKPLFTPKLKESINSKYELNVSASQADSDRMSFEWQAVGSQLLLSSEAYIDFELTVTGKGHLQDALAQMPILRSCSGTAQTGDLNVSIDSGGYGNYIAFGESDCFSSAISWMCRSRFSSMRCRQAFGPPKARSSGACVSRNKRPLNSTPWPGEKPWNLCARITKSLIPGCENACLN